MNKQMYKIYNETNDEKYFKDFNNYKSCYHWIVNHLDLSLSWKVEFKVMRLVSEIRAIS